MHRAVGDTSIYRGVPEVAVNKHGVIGVSWIDGRDDPSGRCDALYFTASLDGGETFLPERRVSSARSCPDSAANGGAFKRWPHGGDYYGLTAMADGRFHLFWADGRAGTFQLWAANVQVKH
jgi:hypothetical protein